MRSQAGMLWSSRGSILIAEVEWLAVQLKLMTCKHIKEWNTNTRKFEFLSPMYPWKYHDDLVAGRQIGQIKN